MKPLQAAAAVVVFGVAAVLLAIGACKGVAPVANGGAVLSLFPSPTTVAPNATSSISITLFESTGQPVPDGTRIAFTSTLGAVDPGTVETRGGYAQVTFRAPADTGEAKITASSGSINTTTTITVGGTAAAIVVSASPASLPVGGGSTTVTATVRDATGGLAAGVPIVFTTDFGTLASLGRPVLTSTSGQASDVLTASRDAKVTAKVSGGTLSGDALVDVAGTGASQLTVTATPASLGAGGGSTLILATALDAAMSPVPGFPVAFSTTAGMLAVLGAVRTDAAGVARNTLTLTTETSATVTASGPGATGSVTVQAGRPTPANLLLRIVADPARIDRPVTVVTPTPVPACADSTSIDITLTATVTANGSPVADVLVLFFAGPPAGSRARVVGRFCELPGNPAFTTAADGTAVVHYTISALERQNCDDIPVPCVSSRCTATPSPCNTPAATPTPAQFLANDCCCALVFSAKVGSVTARTTAVTILAERDCPTPGNKLCGCVF